MPKRLPSSARDKNSCPLFDFGGFYTVKLMSNDAGLLSELAEQASEEAFEELVSRHLDLVLSAALRQVGGDRHLAQDVVQGVFTTLARKSRSLPAHVVLAGWLYRHTSFAAKQAVRSEDRHRRREQEAAAMNLSESITEPAWEQLAPILDQAIRRLRAVERDALILMYFENRDLGSVADALGTSEEAAEKRVSRAVQKLRVFFHKKKNHRRSAVGITFLLTAAVCRALLEGSPGFKGSRQHQVWAGQSQRFVSRRAVLRAPPSAWLGSSGGMVRSCNSR